MNKNWLFIVLGVFLLGTIAFVSAYDFSGMQMRNRGNVENNIKNTNGYNVMKGGCGMIQGNIQYHEQMERIMEEGTYDDLIALREKTGFNMMPFVDNEESFKQMQEKHEQMEKFREENGFERLGMHRKFGMYHCPMMDNS